MTDRELMQRALEGLEAAYEGQIWLSHLPDLSTALRERLAQPEHEPATKAGDLRAMKDEFWKQPEPDGLSWLKKDSNYFSQPKRKPLTDEEIDALPLPPSGTATVRDLVRIIEAAHGIKEQS